jgi:hypothetical protein
MIYSDFYVCSNGKMPLAIFLNSLIGKKPEVDGNGCSAKAMGGISEF